MAGHRLRANNSFKLVGWGETPTYELRVHFQAEAASRLRLIQALGHMIQVFRWLVLIPACIAAWYVALFIGLYVHGIVDSFCPPELVVSGFCEASWFPAAEKAAICFGVALSAFLVVVTAALVAPTHRLLASKAALAIGTLVAIVFAVGTDAYFELAAAVLAGILGVFLVVAVAKRGH